MLFLVVGLAAASQMTAWQVAGPAHRPVTGAVGE
jgi:hypothetical protein